MSATLGSRVQMQRSLIGWTQERLADEAGVDRRTVQRIEVGAINPGSGTVQALAQALGVEVAQLRFGLDQVRLTAMQEQYFCSHCGAELESRIHVDYEHGDVEFEVFSCGHTRGWENRPCPKDPMFPKFQDYELKFFVEASGGWSCLAIGKTESARAVSLSGGSGQTRDEAERSVRRSYVQARGGSEAAEAAYPLFK